MHYKENLHMNSKSQKQFSRNDSCVWIVYPPGSGGDLLSSIINKHYSNTGTNDFGINKLGQVMIVQTDGKVVNIKYNNQKDLVCNESLINDTNKHISTLNSDYSKLDMVLYCNHAWQDNKVKKILEYFPNSKIIRIVVKSKKDNNLITNLKNSKHKYIANADSTINNVLEHERLLNIPFAEIWKKETFDVCYDMIIKHLDLPYKLIRFDYVNFWINQHNDECKRELMQ
jgi:hypothetical protein